MAEDATIAATTEVTMDELKKSVEDLKSILDSDAVVVEKSMEHLGTLGALADKTGIPPLDPNLEEAKPEVAEEISKAQAGDDTFIEEHKHSLAEELADADAAHTEGADTFAKSLVSAFAKDGDLIDRAASDALVKSLVLGTIEGLSITAEELKKSLDEGFSTLETRHDKQFNALAKALIAVAGAVSEIRGVVMAIDNAPVRPLAKSVKGSQILEKSLGAADGSETLTKAMVLGALEKRAQAGKIDAFHVARYESAGVIEPALMQEIRTELGHTA
jgi:hypothetical protein